MWERYNNRVRRISSGTLLEWTWWESLLQGKLRRHNRTRADIGKFIHSAGLNTLIRDKSLWVRPYVSARLIFLFNGTAHPLSAFFPTYRNIGISINSDLIFMTCLIRYIWSDFNILMRILIFQYLDSLN